MLSRLRDILEGRCGVGIAWAVRLPLLPFSFLYACLSRLRAFLYRTGVLKSVRVSVPVISVGNLTAGGTGKTPFVLWLCRQLLTHGLQPAILTRGYHAKTGKEADEVLLFRHYLPNVSVVVNADRVAGARQAIAEGASVLVLDDGFQHLRLVRDLDIVLVDATCPWGGGWVLPAGLLREPISAMSRAGVVCVTHCDEIPASQLADLDAQIASRVPEVLRMQARHQPVRLETLAGETLSLDALHEKPIVAFCGIARPDLFSRTLQTLGACVNSIHPFADHHVYTVQDMEALWQALPEDGVLVTTEKDAVKLMDLAAEEQRHCCWVVGVALSVDTDMAWETTLSAVLPTSPSPGHTSQ